MMSDASLIPDQAVRVRALSPAHSFIVQAPAGSGKTELLTQRYLRLLTTVKQPEQILAITFTRKAASEMSYRILQALQRASELPRPEQSHAAQTWELARAALESDKQYEWNLLSNPSRLRIQTIDALNNSLAKRLPILSGTGAAFEIATDATKLYESAAISLLDQLGDSSEVAAQLEVVLLHVANRAPELIEMLIDLLARRDHWLPLVRFHDTAQLRESMETTLRAAIEHHLRFLLQNIPVECHDELLELVRYAAHNRLQNEPKAEYEPLLHACSIVTGLPGTRHQDVMAWRGIAAVLCKQEGDFYVKVNKLQGFPTTDKEKARRMEALLNALRDVTGLSELFVATHVLPTETYSNSQWQVLSALLSVLPQAVAHLQLEFQQTGKIDFVELALRARAALGSEENPTDLALSLDMRLQHILVDEFQDTSITQMKLLQMLTAGWLPDDGRTLFCVGDPMQSIYRFRQAEVGLFLHMQINGLPNVHMEPLQLRTNFRSSRPVIEWINSQFSYVLPAHNDSEQGAVKYSSSECRPDASTNGGVHVHAAIDRSSQQEALDIVEVIKQALSDATARVAVLVSGRTHVGAIAAALANEGIAFNAVDIESLKDRSLIQDLLALTRALLHLGDRISWLACLRAPWCGLTLQDLHVLAAESPDACVWTLLNTTEVTQQLNGDAQERAQHFIHVLRHALSERNRYSLRDWVQRCWMALSGPALLGSVSELHDANAFFTHLDEVEEAGDISDIAQLEQQLDDLYAAPINSDKAQVEIMTIHKAKGLEFDVVIIPSMHRKSQRDKTQLLRWAQLTGLDVDDKPADGLVLSPPQAKGEDHDPIHQWLKQLEQRRADLERGRLLYVAATRAKYDLHLFGSVDINSKDEIKPPKKGTLLNLLWHAVSHEFERCSHSASVLHDDSSNSYLLRRLPINWKVPDITASAKGLNVQQIVAVNDEPIEFDWVSETGRHVGTVVHAELELLMNSSLEQRLQWNAASRRAFINVMLTEQGVPETLRQAACNRVIAAIENVLTHEKGRWLIGMNDDIQDASNELALSGVVDGVIVNCVLDRTFIDANGTRWIVDFKTSTHEGSDLEVFLQSEEQRYRLQLQRYATLMRAWKPQQTVRTALYFPLMQQWREVKAI